MTVDGAPLALGQGWFFGASIGFAAIAAFAATAWRSGAALFVAIAGTAFVHLHWPRTAASARVAIWVQIATVTVFTFWPIVAHRAFAAQRGAWRAAALTALLHWPSLWWRAVELSGERALERLALILGLIAAAAALRARTLWPPGDPIRTSALAWLGGIGAVLLASAIPHPVTHHTWLPRTALQVLALACLWRRVDHVGLKAIALTFAALVGIGLCVHPVVVSSAPRPTWRLGNELDYTFLLPAAALLIASVVWASRESSRLRRFEARPYAAATCGLLALLLIFVWLNVAIAVFFAEGASVAISFTRHPARDLTTSVTWIAYALILLVLGVAKRSSALRWVSLALMLLAIGKVFLRDLGELRDLYRVASLAGLALSLLAISLLYQRFVFGKKV